MGKLISEMTEKERKARNKRARERARELMKDPEYRTRKLLYYHWYQQTRYHSDPEYRARVLARTNARHRSIANDPVASKQRRKHNRDKARDRWASDFVFRERVLVRNRQRWNNDPQYRARQLVYFKERYRRRMEDGEYREAERARRREQYKNSAIRTKTLARTRERHRWLSANDPQYRKAARERARATRARVQAVKRIAQIINLETKVTSKGKLK